MWAIIGLGNVGEKYYNTRHNAGFLFIDHLAEALGVNMGINQKLMSSSGKSGEWLLVKPTTFMNSSGIAVQSVANFYSLSPHNIFIAHDDLDLKLGSFKIQLGKGPKVHNGVNSIEEHLKSQDFYRIRLGVDNREADNRTPGEQYVLSGFEPDELNILKNTIDEAVEELKKTLNER